jgi:nondiscriminating glutamyl-tRNA synthetase
MRLLVRKLREAGELTPENVKGILKAITKELNLGGKKVFMPIRIALTGRMHGPELHDLIPLIGVNEVVRRIKQSLQLNLD